MVYEILDFQFFKLALLLLLSGSHFIILKENDNVVTFKNYCEIYDQVFSSILTVKWKVILLIVFYCGLIKNQSPASKIS